MNATNTLTVAKPLAEIKGMSLVRSEKTGNTKLALMSKRDFVKGWTANPLNKDKPKKQATRDFDAYRVATLKDFNTILAMQIASGAIQAERVNADKTGDLRTIALVRRDRREQDQSLEAIRRTSEITGIPVDELIKRGKERHTLDANVTIDVQSSEAPAGNGEAPAGNGEAPAEQPTNEPASAPGQPQSVAAGQ